MILTVGIIGTLVFLSFQGCSGETRSTARELGNDLKRDVNQAAQNIEGKVEDALD